MDGCLRWIPTSARVLVILPAKPLEITQGSSTHEVTPMKSLLTLLTLAAIVAAPQASAQTISSNLMQRLSMVVLP